MLIHLQFFKICRLFLLVVIAATLLTGCPSQRKVTLLNSTGMKVEYCKSWTRAVGNCFVISRGETAEIGDSQVTGEFSIWLADKAFYYDNDKYPATVYWLDIDEEYKKQLLSLVLSKDGMLVSSSKGGVTEDFIIEPIKR